MNVSTRQQTERMIELACRAPSVHNTQPWRWRIRRDACIELWADRNRQLDVADPDGRNLAISCGAAVHHLVVAASALGVTSKVDLMPVNEETDLLACIRIVPGPPVSDASERLDAIARRCTDRRRFTTWPIPDSRLAHLSQAAAGWGGYAIPILDTSTRFRSELLLSRAQSTQASDPRFAHEQQVWTDHSAADGIPAPNTAPRSRASSTQRPNRFAPESLNGDSGPVVESSEGLMVICTALDDQRAWLATGQVLSALWLRATRDGLSLVPLSQVVEVEETRNALHHDILAGLAHPQILLRIGWQEIGRSALSPTPRRPLSDVLLP